MNHRQTDHQPASRSMADRMTPYLHGHRGKCGAFLGISESHGSATVVRDAIASSSYVAWLARSHVVHFSTTEDPSLYQGEVYYFKLDGGKVGVLRLCLTL